jgi:hAT family protein
MKSSLLLSKMAINMLSIPCVLAAIERLFSSCGLTLEDRRNRIVIKLLEALECL